MSDLMAQIEVGLWQRLTTAAGTALWGQRVYALQAPYEAALPYVVFTPVSVRDENDHNARSFNAVYQIDVWSEHAWQARQALHYLETALHHNPIVVTGYSIYRQQCENWLAEVENESGKQYWRRGCTVRMMGSQ